MTVSVSCRGQWWIPAIQIQFTIHMCVGYFLLNSYNLIIIFSYLQTFLCTTRDFIFDFFLGQVLETKMLRWLQSKSKIIRYFYRKFLGFSEKLLLQLHAIQLQDFVSNRVIRDFNIGKIKFKYLYIKDWTAYTVYLVLIMVFWMTHVHGTIRLHDNMFMILRHCSSYRAIHLTMYVTLEVKTKKFRCGFKEPYSSDVRNHIHVD